MYQEICLHIYKWYYIIVSYLLRFISLLIESRGLEDVRNRPTGQLETYWETD